MVRKIFNLKDEGAVFAFLSAVILTLVVVAMLIGFFLIKQEHGDIGSVWWRLSLTRVHLNAEWSMPYFTPARCGGFHLAADAQDLLFSIYTLVGFFVINPIWIVKISNFLLSIILIVGMYFWLPYFGVTHHLARFFGALFVAFTGYWVIHIGHAGHVWAHGLCYLPFVMIFIENLFNVTRPPQKRLRDVFCLALFFVLLLNSGYYWLQFGVPVIICRIFVELFGPVKDVKQRIFGISLVVCSVVIALLLSLPRLGGVYEFQIKKFPRLGGDAPDYQVVSSNKMIKRWIWKSFFDHKPITEAQFDENLSNYWDYSNYVGIFAIPFLFLGLCQVRTWGKTKLFTDFY